MYGNSDRNGHLRINSVDAMTPMCRVVNLIVLDRGEDVIGEDTRVSGGKVLNPQRGDGFTETMQLIVVGDVDHNGDPYDDAIAGLRSNLRWIRANLTDRTGTGDGTKTIEVEWNDSIVATGTGRTGPLVIGQERGEGVAASFDLHIPVGTFVDA